MTALYKYTAPIDAEEASYRFEVREWRGDRVLIAPVNIPEFFDVAFVPTECVESDAITPAIDCPEVGAL